MAISPVAAPSSTSGLTYDAFMRLLRSTPQSLDAYFGEIGTGTVINSTNATVHCRYLKLDGNNSPRVKDLADRLARELINYAIPRSDIEMAKTNAMGPHDAKHFAALYRKANQLFTDLAKTGEGGELLLYLMTETYLQIPQLFCKMPLKTSSQMHYHGADGIHGTYEPGTGTLALYWGESKLYATPASAIDACIESLAPFILPNGGSAAPQARDLQLLSDNLDLANPDLEAAILRYLDPDDPSYNQLTYRGVALVGFDSASYKPGSPPLSEPVLKQALESAIDSWHGSVAHHVSKHKLSQIGIELFCVPFPSVEEFRKAFLEELGIK
jgi:Cap4 SAVED domain